MNAAEQAPKQIEEHLKGGGALVAGEEGALRIDYFDKAKRYILSNSTGNGGEYIQESLIGCLHLAEQLAGSLEAWELVQG